MTPERWRKLNSLFHEAIELEGEARATYLRKSCGDDDQLRLEVERLIAAHEQECSFIDTPVYAASAGSETGRTENLTGLSIGPYRVISQLGRGGMGEVFLAEDTRLDRKVALKLLPAAFMRDSDRVRRFEREARAASALNHPNILTIHEIGKAAIESGEAHYIVSEYVEGETLRAKIDRGCLGMAEAAAIADQVAGALSVAHQAGIVHRDIKPENVMIRPDGLVKVLDFGLAKLTEPLAKTTGSDSRVEEASRLSTESGVVVGTVQYMSPEQARGLKVDHRTDIFSLGVMLYEMIAGRRPFDGPTMSDVIAALLTAEPPPLDHQGIIVTEEFERMTEKCLAKDRDARYQSANELRIDLGKFNREAKPATVVTSARSRGIDGRQRSLRNLLVTAFAIPAVVTLVYFIFFRDKTAPEPQSVAEVRSLAVLPFRSLSRNPDDDYLGLGIADAVITRTSRMKSLIVRPLSAVHEYHNRIVDPLEVARVLRVDAVLDGSYQHEGDHLRVSLNLIRAPDGASLWVGTFDRQMKNAFALQDDISSNVVKALRLTLTPDKENQFAVLPTRNAEAWDYYLRGRFYMAREGEENFVEGMKHFERAATLDPSFALAHSDLAAASSAIFFSHNADTKYEEIAYVALEKALALDPNLAKAYVTRANLTWTLVNGFPHERAIRDFRRALEIDPNLAIAHRILGAMIVHLGLLDQALAELQTALRLEPNDRGAPPRIARVYWYQQKYELALAEFEKVNRPSYAATAEMALTLWHLGRMDEALELLEKRLEERSGDQADYDLHAAYAVLLADAGRRREAEEHIRLAIEGGRGISHFHHAEFSIACAYALMGRKELSIEWLENTAEHGMPCYPLFNTEPALDNLRSDPRFREFIEKMKKQWEGYLRDFG